MHAKTSQIHNNIFRACNQRLWPVAAATTGIHCIAQLIYGHTLYCPAGIIEIFYKGSCMPHEKDSKSPTTLQQKLSPDDLKVTVPSVLIRSLSIGLPLTTQLAGWSPINCIWKSAPSQTSGKSLPVPGPRLLHQCRLQASWP